MIRHTEITEAELRTKIRERHIVYGGNARLNIYGTLSCSSGKRMMKINRVFFSSQSEALLQGFRPCGHCMKSEYTKWKNESIRK